jgi:hypothetical protein
MYGNQKQTHWAYIAGIMDADGCFMITKHFRKTPPNRKWNTLEKRSPTYLPSVKVCMVENEAVNFIKYEIGFGNIRIDGARKDRPNSKPIYHWLMRSKKNIKPFLEGIIPFLKVKKDRAEFLLNYCNEVADCSSRYHGLSENELNYREESYVKMREFNGNKVAATTKPLRSERISDSLNS